MFARGHGTTSIPGLAQSGSARTTVAQTARATQALSATLCDRDRFVRSHPTPDQSEAGLSQAGARVASLLLGDGELLRQVSVSGPRVSRRVGNVSSTRSVLKLATATALNAGTLVSCGWTRPSTDARTLAVDASARYAMAL